ncbi:MAG: type IVB secretion system protein IcmH/DotU [Candidatus Eremiobacteraeota bacterium]|nr:type IVB secretion system protein IcmH/DotU [Candidatus Eremiobacteraeota bacterium]
MRRAPRSTPGAAAPAPPATGPNLLLSEADALLALVPALRSTTQVANLARLHGQIAERLQQFDDGARRRGVGPNQAQQAHTVVAILIDHVVQTMPWGASGGWDPLSPLKAAAGESAGHAAIRQLARMAEAPTANRDLRELIYSALALGFEPRAYGPVVDAQEAEQLRANLATRLKRDPSTAAQPLSVRWRPAIRPASAVASWLPLWAGSFVVAGLLAVLYFWLALALGSRSDRVFAQIAALRLPAPAAANSVATAAPQTRLLPLLSGVVREPAVRVRDEADRSVVTLSDAVLFEPGTANLLRSATPLLRRVAAALQTVAGRVQVIGYTDSISERSARYPSNWELSVEQARAVHDALRALGLPAGRMRYDGRADTEPLATSGAAGAAAQDGRVEIALLAGR